RDRPPRFITAGRQRKAWAPVILAEDSPPHHGRRTPLETKGAFCRGCQLAKLRLCGLELARRRRRRIRCPECGIDERIPNGRTKQIGDASQCYREELGEAVALHLVRERMVGHQLHIESAGLCVAEMVLADLP